ncbi:hypothetical protein AY599_04385 [Leptolyngbya valderiana BDU 20041]|nr:hypothetical protein AY599_04385 [Leptolyngbya valderiana BDU 20041]
MDLTQAQRRETYTQVAGPATSIVAACLLVLLAVLFAFRVTAYAWLLAGVLLHLAAATATCYLISTGVFRTLRTLVVARSIWAMYIPLAALIALSAAIWYGGYFLPWGWAWAWDLRSWIYITTGMSTSQMVAVLSPALIWLGRPILRRYTRWQLRLAGLDPARPPFHGPIAIRILLAAPFCVATLTSLAVLLHILSGP